MAPAGTHVLAERAGACLCQCHGTPRGPCRCRCSMPLPDQRLARLEAALARIAEDHQHDAEEGDSGGIICGLCAMGLDDHAEDCHIGIAQRALARSL